MRSRNRPLTLALAGGAVIALALPLFLSRVLPAQNIIDVIMIVAVWTTLVGSYLLRHYSRAHLVYNRHTVKSQADVPGTASEDTRNVTTPLSALTRRVWW